MKRLKKVAKKLVAFAMTIALLCSANALSVVAAEGNNNSASTYGVITPWPENSYLTCNGNSIKSDLFGVRAGQNVRVDVTVTAATGQYPDMGLQVKLVRRYPTENIEQSDHVYWTGNHTCTFTVIEEIGRAHV